MKRYLRITLLLFFVFLYSCATDSKKIEPVHGKKPLIDTKQIINNKKYILSIYNLYLNQF